MNCQWTAAIELFAVLDRSQAFAELVVALVTLSSDVPDSHRVVMAPC